MGMKLTLEEINTFICYFSKTGEKRSKPSKELRLSINNILQNQIFYSSNSEKESIQSALTRFKSEADEGVARDILRDKIKFFSVILLDSNASVNDEVIFLQKFFETEGNIFPGLVTVLREVEPKSGHVDAVHPWMNKILSSLASWPAIFICTPKKSVILSLSNNQGDFEHEVKKVGKRLAGLTSEYGYLSFLKNIFPENKQNIDVIFHISDLHVPSKSGEERFSILEKMLKNEKESANLICSNARVGIVFTGDLMNNAIESELEIAEKARDRLQKITKDCYLLPGNHDSKIYFGNIGRQKNQRYRDLFNPGVKTLFDDKVTLVGLDSNIFTVAARGNVPSSDLQGYEEMFSQIHKKGAFVIGALHHHPVSVSINPPFKKDWYERWFGPIQSYAIELHNSEEIKSFFKKIGVNFVLFGHKHQPHFVEENDIHYIGCGSSLGYRDVQDEDVALGYNKITINHDKRIASVEYVLFRCDFTRITSINKSLRRSSHIVTIPFDV